jgi:phage/plasmid-like protein (TIGR03299 family)
MFYYGEKPWHDVGVELDKPATAKEAIQAARLDFKVELAPMHYINPVTANRTEIKFGKVVRRTDNGRLLGVVGNDYKPVQNIEAFSFFDGIVGEGKAIYHTAGALGDGEKIWILAKLPGDIQVTNKDNVEKYLLLTNSHNGRSSLRMYFTPIRVVCQNTLILSAQQMSNTINIRHVGSIKGKIDQARQLLGIVNTFYDTFGDITKQLLRKKLTKEELKKYYGDVVFRGLAEVNTPIMNNRLATLNRLFETGKGNDFPEVRGSVWAALNACSEYVDHYQEVKNRLKNSWFGLGAIMKQRAWDGALSLIK